MSEPSNITPEMAARVLEANWKNVVKKVAAGRTLNATELALIKAKAAGSNETVTHAKDTTDLARILGVTRQTLYEWRKKPDAPQSAADGSHDVIAWRLFIANHDLKASLTPDADALRARKLLAEIEDRELRVALKKGQYVLKAEVEAEWFRRFAVLKSLLYSKLTLEIPPLSVGKDAIGIQQINQNGLDQALREAATAR
jgi:transposase-like protein